MRMLGFALIPALAAQSAAGFGEDGAAGWLRYAPVSNPKQYASLPATVAPLDHSPVIESAASEAARGLGQMLGHPVVVGNEFSAMPELVIGTVTEVEARFPHWKPPAQLKP